MKPFVSSALKKISIIQYWNTQNSITISCVTAYSANRMTNDNKTNGKRHSWWRRDTILGPQNAPMILSHYFKCARYNSIMEFRVLHAIQVFSMGCIFDNLDLSLNGLSNIILREIKIKCRNEFVIQYDKNVQTCIFYSTTGWWLTWRISPWAVVEHPGTAVMSRCSLFQVGVIRWRSDHLLSLYIWKISTMRSTGKNNLL